MAKSKTFWTKARLAELRKLAKTMHVGQLCAHFIKPADEVRQALEYATVAHKCPKKGKVTICPTMHAYGYGFASVRAKKGHYSTQGVY
jgi:hypothetical protein